MFSHSPFRWGVKEVEAEWKCKLAALYELARLDQAYGVFSRVFFFFFFFGRARLLEIMV